MSVRVPVAPEVLEWARERSGRSEDEAERRFHRWRLWVSGDASPTVTQVEEIAAFTRAPFGVFFLEEPPPIELPIHDFRLGSRGGNREPSPDLLECVYLSQQRQDWFREYALRTGLDPVALVGAGHNRTPAHAARLALGALEFTPEDRPRRREDARNHLRRRFEAAGGLVVFAGVVGNNTSRPLDRGEFRGFTLADEYAPLIFVNTHDTLSGQLFTFFHELGHLMRAESGVSDEDVRSEATDESERWCNAFAAEALVPADDLRRTYHRAAPLRTELDALAARYLCSTLVVLLRLHEIDLIPSEGFDELFESERAHIDHVLRSVPPRAGGDFWRNQPFRTSERLARAVLSDTREGRTSYSEAMRLLGLKTADALESYATHLELR